MTEPLAPAHLRDQIRRVVAAIVEGAGLHMEERRLELIITNPRDPERGQVCIGLDDGYVSWERTVTDYWGHLDGLSTQDPDIRAIPATKIIEALTGRM